MKDFQCTSVLFVGVSHVCQNQNAPSFEIIYSGNLWQSGALFCTTWNILEHAGQQFGVWLVDPFIFSKFYEGTQETSKKSPGIDG